MGRGARLDPIGFTQLETSDSVQLSELIAESLEYRDHLGSIGEMNHRVSKL